MTHSCEGKIALVTGAATGIGRSCALKLAEAGAKLVVTDIDVERVEETARLIEAAGGQARAAKQDVTREEGWLSLIHI